MNADIQQNEEYNICEKQYTERKSNFVNNTKAN